jgi:hypothetical protein
MDGPQRLEPDGAAVLGRETPSAPGRPLINQPPRMGARCPAAFRPARTRRGSATHLRKVTLQPELAVIKSS